MTEAEGRRKLMTLAKFNPIKLQRIESGGTDIGIPDLFFRTEKKDGWMELKCVEVKPERLITIPFRAKQLQWLNDYNKLGGNGILCLFFDIDMEYYAAFYKGKHIKKSYTVDELTAERVWMGLFQDLTFSWLEQILDSECETKF